MPAVDKIVYWAVGLILFAAFCRIGMGSHNALMSQCENYGISDCESAISGDFGTRY